MPFDDLPTFITALQQREAIAARALEFTILTAARTSETLNAQYGEFDLEKKLWVLPAERMKSGRSHTVPLLSRAQEIIDEMKVAPRSSFVFPGNRPKRSLSNMSMMMLLRRMGHDEITVHGFRSSFRDWAGDCTSYPREVAEAALSHSIGDTVERSYRRKDALEKRRSLMDSWASFCLNAEKSQVVSLHG